MPGSSAWIMKIGASMLASIAACQSARFQSSNPPGGGPALLFTRMSASEQAAISAARPSSVLMSARIGITFAPVASRISVAARSRRSGSSPLMTTEQHSRASAVAHALPRPRDEAHTIVLRSLIPRSIFVSFSAIL
jgi:hypothetical protein